MLPIDLSQQILWQVGAGADRSYGHIFLGYDIMMVGPGSPGEYSEEAYSHLGDIKNSIRRFYQDAKKGDPVLLRVGTGQVLAVGLIADDMPQWMPAFGDIDGWDLQHVRRVRWLQNTAKEFPTKTLGGQVRTFAAVNVQAVKNWVASITIDESDASRELAALPDTPITLDRGELGRRLFVEGLPSEYIDKLLAAISSLDRVASWYDNEFKRPEGRPSEHETVAYLVVPLLFALGWSQQTAAIEWRNIDVALFGAMPANDSNLRCVVEAKLLGRSVFSAVGQARDYALLPGREACQKLIVTDGIRYTVHERSANGFLLSAYMNVLDLREHYPLHKCGGAVDALLLMAR